MNQKLEHGEFQFDKIEREKTAEDSFVFFGFFPPANSCTAQQRIRLTIAMSIELTTDFVAPRKPLNCSYCLHCTSNFVRRLCKWNEYNFLHIVFVPLYNIAGLRLLISMKWMIKKSKFHIFLAICNGSCMDELILLD